METPSDIRVVRLGTRAGWAAGLGALWAAGYFTLGARASQVSAFDPSIALDTWIPFIGWAVWLYLLGIVGIVLPVGLIRSNGLFCRAATAYAMVIAVSFLCFFFLPTDGSSLRQYASTYGLDSVTGWALDILYAIDPPANLLPSLHVSLGTLSALACTKEYPAYRPLAYLGLVALAASVCAVKQHSIVDVVSGTTLALAAFSVAMRVNLRRLFVTV